MEFLGFRVENIGLRLKVFSDFKGQGLGYNTQDLGFRVLDCN